MHTPLLSNRLKLLSKKGDMTCKQIGFSSKGGQKWSRTNDLEGCKKACSDETAFACHYVAYHDGYCMSSKDCLRPLNEKITAVHVP